MKFNRRHRRRHDHRGLEQKPGAVRPKADDDDSSVDSKGNLRGLIDYDYDSSDASEYSESSFEFDEETDEEESAAAAAAATAAAPVAGKRKTRAAAIHARNMIRELTLGSAMDDEEDDDVIVPPKKKTPKPSPEMIPLKARSRSRSAVAMEVEDDDSEDEEEDDDYDEEDDADADDTASAAGGAITLPNLQAFSISIGEPEADRLVPKRHNMKKEAPDVKEFVELITKPVEENDIDAQIDFYKSLAQPKRTQLLEALKNRPTAGDSSMTLMFKILTMNIDSATRALVLGKYQALLNLDPGTSEYYKQRNWLDKFCSVPFGQYTDMPVRIEDGPERCGEFMARARKCLDDSTFGQEEAKLQILQFIASKITNPDARGQSLLLIGPPGIGKTTLIKNGIAKALGWPFQFISLGGDSDASTYTGHQLVYESSHSGKIVNSLVAAKSMSMVLMFDEVDKISQTPKGEEIANMLIHLTDPVQNSDFEDKYLANIPIDLGKVMFVFSANDINKIDRVLLDRMLVVHLAGYSQLDKVSIAQNHLLPAALREVNLTEKVGITREIVEYIIEKYAKAESGVRELKRCLESIVQKINMLRMYNDKALPFHIPGFSLPFVVKKDHIDIFLKKREAPRDEPPAGMYV